MTRQEQIAALIADDAYAMTFQTLGQYRSALLAALQAEPPPADTAAPMPQIRPGDVVITRLSPADEALVVVGRDTQSWCNTRPDAIIAVFRTPL